MRKDRELLTSPKRNVSAGASRGVSGTAASSGLASAAWSAFVGDVQCVGEPMADPFPLLWCLGVELGDGVSGGDEPIILILFFSGP
jgi:hypothetical protein